MAENVAKPQDRIKSLFAVCLSGKDWYSISICLMVYQTISSGEEIHAEIAAGVYVRETQDQEEERQEAAPEHTSQKPRQMVRSQ